MNTIANTIRLNRFDYLYMFVLIIYMGQATPETSRMVSGLSGNPIGLLIPMAMTLILWTKHPISFTNNRFLFVLGGYTLWASLSIIKYGIYTTGELSYHFFMIYAIVVAYIMDAIYGYSLLSLYEKVLVWFCKISIILWLISMIPGTSSIFSMFPKTYVGSNVLYIFEWSRHSIRNAGVAWEPGRFAIMIVLGLYCNLCRNGIKFRNNSNIWWLLAALASTMSTTGFTTAIVLYGLFMLKKINVKSIFTFILIMGPIILASSQLDFMHDKITDRIEAANNIDRWKENFRWHNKHTPEDEYISSIDRFEAMSFELLNIQNDPILGYGRDFKHSYFYNNLSKHHSLAHGLLKVFGMYGIILGMAFYIILWMSSKRIGNDSNFRQPIALFIIICLSSISYQILSVPIFTAFWFWGLFASSNHLYNINGGNFQI